MLAHTAKSARADPAHTKVYWAPAIRYLHAHLSPSYRVEAVDTAEHWAAAYLPDAGIPIVRGWYRQSDFPQNELLYDRSLAAAPYEAWLRRLGVRYVVLTDAPVDYSATAADLVDGTDPVSCSRASGETFAIGTTTVDCSTTDVHFPDQPPHSFSGAAQSDRCRVRWRFRRWPIRVQTCRTIHRDHD